MKSCAIITEYNPLHNGHVYQLQTAKKETQADVMIVIMSGNFVQRGEPALLDKHTRAKLALQNGADLVIELPWYGAVQAADYFGEIAVDLLQSLSVDVLCFGTDIDEPFDYVSFVRLEQQHKEQLDEYIKWLSHKYPTWSYPRKMEQAYQDVLDQGMISNKPNHILGLSYARANFQGEKPMQLWPIKRLGAGHYDGIKNNFASGTAIRDYALNKNYAKCQKVVPKETLNALMSHKPHTWDDYFILLKMQILSKSISDLQQIYQMTDGLEYKIIEVTKTSHNFAEWLDQLKSKRYTIARLQRLATYILLNIKTTHIEFAKNNPYLKILGFTGQGQKFLKQAQSKYPIVTTIRQQNLKVKELEQRIDEIYHLPTGDKFSFAKQYQPIIIKNV